MHIYMYLDTDNEVMAIPYFVYVVQTNTYKQVIEDVVKNMKEEYLNEGADTEMLEELRTVCGPTS